MGDPVSKLIKISLIVIITASVALNARLFFLLDDAHDAHDAHDDLYLQITNRYLSDQNILEEIESKRYKAAVELLQEYSKEYGSMVAIICMERECE
jgi:hypothetical protein